MDKAPATVTVAADGRVSIEYSDKTIYLDVEPDGLVMRLHLGLGPIEGTRSAGPGETSGV